MLIMKLNILKCVVLHFGKNNPKFSYSMEDYDTQTGITLPTSSLERDLGIHLSTNLKSTNQSNFAASKANSIFGMMKRTFVSRDLLLWKKLYYYIHKAPS